MELVERRTKHFRSRTWKLGRGWIFHAHDWFIDRPFYNLPAYRRAYSLSGHFLRKRVRLQVSFGNPPRREDERVATTSK